MHRYFGLMEIGNVKTPLTNPLGETDLQNLANNTQEVKKFYDRFYSEIIPKAI